MGTPTALEVGLLGAGYAASVPAVVRFASVVRHRRVRWLAVHHLGMAAIIAGWTLRGRPAAAVVNAVWLAASTVWYATGRRVNSRSDNPHTPDTWSATP